MKIEFSSADSYPVSPTTSVKEYGFFEGKVADSAWERLDQHLAAKVGMDESLKLNTLTDPRDKDIKKLIAQYKVALSMIEAISTGAFTSTDENPTYAGGVVAPGHRIFTPAEAAANALEMIANLEARG